MGPATASWSYAGALRLFSRAVAAIDGSNFKAANTREKNFTPAKLKARMEQVGASIARYMAALDATDRQCQEGEVAREKDGRLNEKISALRRQMAAFRNLVPVIEVAPAANSRSATVMHALWPPAGGGAGW